MRQATDLRVEEQHPSIRRAVDMAARTYRLSAVDVHEIIKAIKNERVSAHPRATDGKKWRQIMKTKTVLRVFSLVSLALFLAGCTLGRRGGCYISRCGRDLTKCCC